MAQECEVWLTANPEWDAMLRPDHFDTTPQQWYARDMIRWTPVPERYCGKHAFGPRDQPMTPKHFSVAQEILVQLVHHEPLIKGWDHGTILDPKNYLSRLFNVKTKESIPGEIYAL